MTPPKFYILFQLCIKYTILFISDEMLVSNV